MDIGIGLPTTIAGTTGEQVVEWARRADRAGFSSLGTIDRLVYDNYEPLIALAGAAGATERIRLLTSVLLAPLRTNAALLAKQAASLQKLSNGRLVLGMGVGGRDDDFDASGVPMAERGRRMDEALAEMTAIWAGEERGFAGAIGPDVRDNPPSVILGGGADATFRRAAQYGDAWILGGQPPEGFVEPRETLRAAFRNAGRPERPRALAITYFSLDDDPESQAQATIGDYYGFLGDYAEQIVGYVAKGEDQIRERVRGFEAVECDELILFPSSPDPDQVDKLAAAVL
jgi:alkanesulfonate monooxygenase SsuD/methylene tetrahydromethanopterin reductase-like flavin-dependent oxidoreductase (luciferase family)